MLNVLTIGDAVVDTHLLIDDATIDCDELTNSRKICFDYGAKIPITDSFQSLGGNAANVAAGLAALGFNTAIITTVGADSLGKIIKNELKNQTVDTRFIGVDQKSKTRYSTILNFKGERTVLSYHRRRRYHWPKILPPADWIYYTSLSEGFENLQTKLIKFLESHSAVKLAINPGSFQLKKSLNKILEIIEYTDILFVNVQEAELLAKTTLSEVKSISALIHRLLALGAKEVVITDSMTLPSTFPGLKILPIAPLLANVIRHIEKGESVTEIYK